MNIIKYLRAVCSLLLLVLVIFPVFAHSEEFVVNDIRVEGLQRVSAGTIFSQFPISVGDTANQTNLAQAARTLFSSGLFTDIKLARDDDDLIVIIKERPAISKIEIEGNENIPEEDLREGLKSAGMVEGKVFKRVTLERLELEILRSYVSQGRYSASVEAEVEDLPRNRVAINLKINEGEVATIKHINITGNDAFEDEEIIGLMELSTPGFWSFFTGDDKYAKEKLSGDLERIRSFYLDRGYIKFTIESTQVSISPSKEDVFVTVNVSEGPLFTVREVDLKGDLVVDRETIEKLIVIEPGDTFSREKLTLISDLIGRLLGAEGYTYANVNAIPEPHDDNTASVTFFVDPGRRNYVRRINFRGNINTKDEVLRQEMRQMEGASASTQLIESSKTRLERLGFFSTVNVDTPSVPGFNDQIDVNYTVEEQSSGSLSASLGFTQGSGFTLGLSVSESNFFGSGKRVSFGVNTSDSVKSANISYLNPYYTVDGVSRGFSLFARKTDFDEQDTSDYVIDNIGGSVTFGYPINNITRLSFTFGYNNTQLSVGDFPPAEIASFTNSEGETFDDFFARGSWSRSTLNRGTLPTKGWGQSLSLEVTLPGITDQHFYKASYRSNFYYPITKDHRWVVRYRSEWAYARDYGPSDILPFYEHYFTGGIGSVRGYENGSLGRRAINNPADNSDPDPFGGNQLIENSWELIMPMPFIEDQKSMRLSLFVDSGNVFDTIRGFDPDLEEIRFTTGLGFQWLTFIGPIGLSFAKALNDQPGDDLQFFQFSLGQPF